MTMRHSAIVSVSALLLLAAMIELCALGREIQIFEEGQKRRIETTTHQDRELLSLGDLAEIFSLQLRERGSSLTVLGARGEILITDGRPLVRSGDHYVLLSGAVWKRQEGDWYVPEDFLVNALSNIVSRRLDRRTDGTFELVPLKSNPVRVRMDRYPDHLSVIFDVSETAPVQVREFTDYLEVIFTEFLVRPQEVAPSPDPRLVAAVEFNEQEALGSFRIQKGSQFSSFRRYYLEASSELIIEVYGTSSPGVADSLPVSDPPSLTPSLSPDPGGVPVPLDVVVVDPGHGGFDYGVDAYKDLSEKVITLNVARMVERALIEAGVEVRLTRARDVQLAKDQRSAISNFYRCRLYVGIHVGGAPTDSTRGAVVYVYDPPREPAAASMQEVQEDRRSLVPWSKGQLGYLAKSRQFADGLQTELNRVFNCENQVVEARVAVLAPVRAPAVLLEAGFLTSTDDQGLLAAPGFQEQVALTIAGAITQFLRSDRK